MAASKMLNPKRKCLNIAHFEQFLELNRNKKLANHLRTKRDCFRVCLKFQSWMSERIADASGKYSRFPQSIWQADCQLNYEISRAIGLLLGYHLYSGVMSNKIPGTWIKSLFSQPIESFSEIWALIFKFHRRIYSGKKINS